MASTCDAPMSAFDVGATKIVRELGRVSPSYEITLIPFAAARLRVGATAAGSGVEITIALKCCWIAVLMNGTCAAPDTVVGPLYVTESPNALAASLAPIPFCVNTGIVVVLGRKKILYPACFFAVPAPAESVTASATRTVSPAMMPTMPSLLLCIPLPFLSCSGFQSLGHARVDLVVSDHLLPPTVEPPCQGPVGLSGTNEV